ncbi:N-acetylmuramoyl-L-alanine amidase [Amycolatopsis jejuensis]|uniref:N-acetylmuramoyl-L-alanine amidase n=1 Tax=Amycolatopsis jejuensis TaxID=330084 RepID=UPI00068F2512|nr:peptidoglycan recognition family protein [Amycolatopsis jejuensis]
MMLTSLANVARSAGLRVVEQPGWTGRGHGQMSGVRAIVCHHTAGAPSGNAPSLGVVQNGRSDLAGPLAHYVLGRDGTVYVVAAGLCWHAGAVLNSAWSNDYAVGIEAEATGVDAWPEVQLDAYARLCKAICVAFGLPLSHVLGHKEVCSPPGRKNDPNFDMTGFRARVATVGTAVPPTPPHFEEDDMPSVIDHEYQPSQDRQYHHRTIETRSRSQVVGDAWFSLSAGYQDITDLHLYFNHALAPIVIDRVPKDTRRWFAVPDGCESISWDYVCTGPSSSNLVYGPR